MRRWFFPFACFFSVPFFSLPRLLPSSKATMLGSFLLSFPASRVRLLCPPAASPPRWARSMSPDRVLLDGVWRKEGAGRPCEATPLFLIARGGKRGGRESEGRCFACSLTQVKATSNLIETLPPLAFSRPFPWLAPPFASRWGPLSACRRTRA